MCARGWPTASELSARCAPTARAFSADGLSWTATTRACGAGALTRFPRKLARPPRRLCSYAGLV
eukprot:2407687-Prymnesium_polylepis.1